ncbi:MAG TPA: hypothetical protein VFN64_10350 [Burkholderiaceae bacterium]|nr:hypothetical protein [Burkholderiaceae bacterium]
MAKGRRRADHLFAGQSRRSSRGSTMQVDAISNDDVQTGKAMKRAMSLLAAFAVAAAAGLATVDVPEADLAPRVLKTDANEYGVRTTTPAQTPAAPAGGEIDPALQRPDRGNDQHG